MEQTKLKALELNAAKARLYGVQMVHDAASGHPGGSMSCMDVLTYLYFAEMRVDPKNPHDPGRDRFVMSKGHCSPAMYPVLALRGFFPVEDLKMFRRIDGHMSGHVEMKYVPGVDMSTGSLGQGISVAVGMALAGKVAKKDYRVYAILGAAYREAEQTKGQPTMILAKTVKGKGVSFMENNAGWHGKAPNDEQWAQAKAELEAKIKELEG